MNVLALCAGVGGLELGVKLANPTARCVCYVEGEAYAAAILVKRMEEKSLDEAPIWSDVRTFDGKPWRGKVDCITGGYPCQPFASIGKRKGQEDHRHLWPHIRRTVEEVKPRRCFFENVSGHLSLGFETVANDLQAMDYKVAAGLFTAEEVGATHKRERLFIMADTESVFGTEIKWNKSDGVHECLSLFPPSPDADSEWLESIRERPDLEPTIYRMADGMGSRMDRFRACGNGVVPLVGAYAWRILEDSLKV